MIREGREAAGILDLSKMYKSNKKKSAQQLGQLHSDGAGILRRDIGAMEVQHSMEPLRLIRRTVPCLETGKSRTDPRPEK
jgi:hypothetical protein